MKPFNIKIEVAEKEVTLTILPYDQDCYRVIYFGGILGALKFHPTRENWELLPYKDAIGDDLPPYSPDDDGERVEIKLDPITRSKIGAAIVRVVSF